MDVCSRISALACVSRGRAFDPLFDKFYRLLNKRRPITLTKKGTKCRFCAVKCSLLSENKNLIKSNPFILRALVYQCGTK
jgi:hypothetical protein